MKAPILDFYEEIVDDENDVYVCNNKSCGAHIVRVIHIVSYKMNEPAIVCVEDNDCINVYSKPRKTHELERRHIIALSPKSNGTTSFDVNARNGNGGDELEVFCRSCDGFLGHRIGSLIHFVFENLDEVIINELDHCVHELPLPE